MRSTNEPAENLKPTPAPLFKLSNLLSDFRADADAAHESRKSGQPRGAISGLPTFDRELNGAFAPGLNMVTGNAGTGKTALLLQIASECKCPALFVTCEMAPVELLRRLTARITGTYLGRLKSGELSGAKVEEMARLAINAVPDLFILDVTRGTATPLQLLAQATVCREQYPDEKHFLMAIDSLQTYTQSLSLDTGASEYESLNASIRQLQMMASELQQPLLLTSERNRDSMKSGGLNAGAGTRKIEYQAETVIDLDREDTPPDAKGDVVITLKLAKNRHGTVGKKIPLTFNGALQRFTDDSSGTNGSNPGGVTVVRRELI